MSTRRQGLEPMDFRGLRTTSLKDRPSKVCLADFGKPWEPGSSLARFLDSLPRILAAEQFREAVGAIASAFRGNRTILMGMGAHPIKVGLNPILIDVMERGILSGLALNGAGIVHDVELALAGKTSEDVAAHLNQGQFGTARETAEFIHDAVAWGFRTGNQGLGRTVGEKLLQAGAPFAHMSLLAAAAKLEIPVTVHVAVGTDIVHMHAAMDGAATGALSHYDFRLFCRLVSTLQQGVFLNLGSAVIIPEVFLKAVSVARNLGFSLEGITTINMDFQRHYRTQVNVVERPTLGTGSGINLIGHHEIMFPLLMAAVLEQLDGRKDMSKRMRIHVGAVSMAAELNDSPTAAAIHAALPLEAAAQTWGDEIYFRVPVEQKLEDSAVEVVAVGDLGYWPTGRAFCIFFGPTPASRGDEIRPASAVNLVGRVLGDATVFRAVEDGELVRLEHDS